MADYCPFYQGWANGACDDPSNLPANNYRAERYGASSRCFATAVSQVINPNPNPNPNPKPNPSPTPP